MTRLAFPEETIVDGCGKVAMCFGAFSGVSLKLPGIVRRRFADEEITSCRRRAVLPGPTPGRTPNCLGQGREPPEPSFSSPQGC